MVKEIEKKKPTKTRKPIKKKSEEVEDKRSVEEIIVARLIDKIENGGKGLPWLKPFFVPCMNWYTKKEYRGINIALLQFGSGEYITMKQLKEYNEANGTKYWVKKGSKAHNIVFSERKRRKISYEKAQELIREGNGHYVREIDGVYYRLTSILKPYNVFDIEDTTNADGEALKSHIGNGVGIRYKDADKIVEDYLETTGVTVNHHKQDSAYFTRFQDAVFIPDMQYFKQPETYYRTLFHELIHSTGVQTRLNRPCYEDYHKSRKQRSKEELVAEVGSMFLCGVTGLREDNKLDLWDYNSENYVMSWVRYLKDNPKEVISAFSMAERAKSYIMGNKETREDTTEVSIS